MSTTLKLGIALGVSVIINVVLVMIILQPTPQDTSIVDKELARKREEINAYKKQIILRDIRIKSLQTSQDSLTKEIQNKKQQLIKNNEAVYQIPDSELNDTLHAILNGI